MAAWLAAHGQGANQWGQARCDIPSCPENASLAPLTPALNLTLTDKVGDKAETIIVTSNHPFQLKGKGWTPAGKLKAGDEVEASSGRWLKVAGISKLGRRLIAYNMEVQNYHTYFVGKSKVWVHNNGCGEYENPGHHDPSGGGPNPYNPTKSVLPKDHVELWQKSKLGSDGKRWTKVGSGKKAVYHRFQSDGNGNWHWNGSTAGKTARGEDYRIKMDDVPPEIKRQ